MLGPALSNVVNANDALKSIPMRSNPALASASFSLEMRDELSKFKKVFHAEIPSVSKSMNCISEISLKEDVIGKGKKRKQLDEENKGEKIAKLDNSFER